MKANDAYPRDMIGYGATLPDPRWPGNARLALQFVLNFEEGGENSVLHGDPASEVFLSELSGSPAYTDRHLSMESVYEYGSRSGFWRLYRLLTHYQVPVTVFGVTMAMQRHPEAVQAMLKADWELACHGLRWISYQQMDEATEAAHMQQALRQHQQLTGKPACGWYTGRTSPNTLALVATHPQILYCADSYADDLPYYDYHYHRPLLMVPYTLDTNDMRFATSPGFTTAGQFFEYLKGAFDTLYAEGATSPKMLSVGMHCRLLGRPARIAALKQFLDYVYQHDGVWVATREAIAQHWQRRYGPENK